jgi:hypothetical protein
MCRKFVNHLTFTNPTSFPLRLTTARYMASSGFVGDNVLVAHKIPLCFFVPGSGRRKWTYAITTDKVTNAVGTAPVLNEDGSLVIFSAKDISLAFDRLKDTSGVVGKAFEPPTYMLRFKQECKALQLFDIYDSFYKKPIDERESLFQQAHAQYAAAKGKGPKTQRPKDNVAKGKSDPPVPVSKWKLQTQVATDRPIVPVGMVTATFGTYVSKDDHLPPCKRWVTGVMIKFGTDALCPYEIQWNTQPIPMVQRVSPEDMAQLVENFKSCVKLRLLRGSLPRT